MTGLNQIMSTTSDVVTQVGIEVCKSCGKVHPSLFTGIEENFMEVALGFSIIAMVVTTLCGWGSYDSCRPKENRYSRDVPASNSNIWNLTRYQYKEQGGGLSGAWFAYCLFNFTVTVFLLSMFPFTIILPLVLGTLKTVLLCIVFYYGISIWVMVAVSIIGWYLYLIGSTLTMFKPYKKEEKK